MSAPRILLLVGALCMTACSGASVQQEHSAVVTQPTVSLIAEAADAEERQTTMAPALLRVAELGGEERAALWARPPSSLRFAGVSIGADARLSFGFGTRPSPAGEIGVSVDFAVVVESDGLPAEVWRRTLELATEDRGWTDSVIDLTAFAGRAIDLVLITESTTPRAVGPSFWGHPVIAPADDARRGGDRTATSGAGTLVDRPVRRELLVERLTSDRADPVPVPRDAGLLKLSGEVTRLGATPVPSDDVTFRVLVAGEPWFEHAVQPTGRTVDFGRTVELPEADERSLQLVIDVPESLRGRVRARWLQAAVLREETVARQAAGSGPNLLLVVVDALRADHLSLYGHSRETSPVLDRFAEESAVFEQAISASSWTMPATASLMSGLSPAEHGVTDGVPLVIEIETLAERLQALGLATFAVSANPLVGRPAGYDQGFEAFVHLPWARAATVNDVLFRLLDANSGSRWFAYVHYIDPHDPYDAPDSYGAMFREGPDSRFANPTAFAELVNAVNFGIGEAMATIGDVAYLKSAYDGEIRYWDTQFGHLLANLERDRLLNDTIVVVTSDHGEEFLEHGRMKHGPQLYEESIRVPLLIRAPHGIEEKRHRPTVETRRLVDLSLALAAADSSEPVDPLGFLQPPDGVALSHSEHGLTGPRQGRTRVVSARDDRWKTIWYPDAGRRELYDLLRDAGELGDLAARDRERVLPRYAAILEAWVSTTPITVLVAEGEQQRILERLRALGYIR